MKIMNECLKNQESAVAETVSASTKEPAYVKPHYRARQDEKGYSLRVYVPGVGKSGVTLSLAKDILTVTATRAGSKQEGWTPLRQELSAEGFRLRLHLDSKVDPDKITAKLEDGVLDVALPLKEAAKPRVIDVG